MCEVLSMHNGLQGSVNSPSKYAQTFVNVLQLSGGAEIGYIGQTKQDSKSCGNGPESFVSDIMHPQVPSSDWGQRTHSKCCAGKMLLLKHS